MHAVYTEVASASEAADEPHDSDWGLDFFAAAAVVAGAVAEFVAGDGAATLDRQILKIFDLDLDICHFLELELFHTDWNHQRRYPDRSRNLLSVAAMYLDMGIAYYHFPRY